MKRDEFEAGMAAAVAEANERIASCHERVACPKCGARIGERCHRAGQRPSPAPLKHPHRERWTLVQAAR